MIRGGVASRSKKTGKIYFRKKRSIYARGDPRRGDEREKGNLCLSVEVITYPGEEIEMRALRYEKKEDLLSGT